MGWELVLIIGYAGLPLLPPIAERETIPKRAKQPYSPFTPQLSCPRQMVRAWHLSRSEQRMLERWKVAWQQRKPGPHSCGFCPAWFFPMPQPAIQLKPALPQGRLPGRLSPCAPLPAQLAARSHMHRKPLEGPKRTLFCRWKSQISTGTILSEAVSTAAG